MFELFETHIDEIPNGLHHCAGLFGEFAFHEHELSTHHAAFIPHELEVPRPTTHLDSEMPPVQREAASFSDHEPPLHAEHVPDHAVGGLVEWWKDVFHDFWHWVSPHEVVTIGGDPDAEKHYWHLQEGQNSCAIAAQTSVLESVLHRHFDENEMATIAHEKGWYSPETGTPLKDVGKLLEQFGIPVERHTDYTFTQLYDAVNRGEKVIVGLNANEIWHPEHSSDGHPLQQLPAGHAVWVTGFEMNEQGKVVVVLNDTGTPDGRGSQIPVDDFRNAWKDYSNFAVVAHTNGATHAA